MQPQELEKRLRRAQDEQMVIMQVEGGVRVYAVQAPHRQYIVAGSAQAPTCTCPDFEHHQDDPDWRCKHILAVQAWQSGAKAPASPKQAAGANGQPGNGSHMLIKRSVSPDGRIDSLSVEFSLPIGGSSPQQVVSLAKRSIRLGSEIADGFRRGNSEVPESASNGSDGLTPAIIQGVEGTDTQYGRRLFLTVRVNGQIRRYFGSAQQIAAILGGIGYPDHANQIREGAAFNLPCRVQTAPTEDGRYVNVVKIVPAQGTTPPRS